MRNGFVLLAAITLGTLAHAEGTGGRERLASGPDRVRGTISLTRMTNGTLLSMGGSSLRVLAPGARSWQMLHQIPHGSLYRVASSDAGGILAAWESPSDFLYFPPGSRRPIALKKPQAADPRETRLGLQFLAFHPDGKSALVRMEGEVMHDTGSSRGERRQYSLYRVPLDGTSPPELLYKLDGAQLVHQSQRAAVYLIPEKLGPECNVHSYCSMASIVAYEVGEKGATQRTLLTREQVKFGSSTFRVSGSDDDRVVLAVPLERNARGLLWWRRGEATADFRPFVPAAGNKERLHVTKRDEVLQLVTHDDELEVHRFPRTGAPTVTTLHAPDDPIDTDFYSVGLRSNGTLFLHWGDELVLFPDGKPPLAYEASSLLGRRDEWGGVDLYVDSPESVWLSVEIGAGRDFVRLPFAEIEQKARPWPHD